MSDMFYTHLLTKYIEPVPYIVSEIFFLLLKIFIAGVAQW